MAIEVNPHEDVPMMMKRKGNTVDTRVARKGEWLALASLTLAIAGALPGHAAAANYTTSNQAQLIAAINTATASHASTATVQAIQISL